MLSMNDRQAFLDDLSSVISKERKYAQDILNKLQWTEEQVMEAPNMVQCPVNANHQVPESSLAKHTAACRLIQEGYSCQDQKEMTNNDWFYANTKSVQSISIDQSTQNQILTRVSGQSGIKPVPKTVERREKDLTSDERLAVYEYVVQKAKEQGAGDAVPLEDLAFDPTTAQKDKKNAETIAAMKAKQRDLKRRRQTYRAKNVHITRRSQTQIMKEIIDMQMSEIIEAHKDEEDTRRKEERRKERREDRLERRDDKRERRREHRRDEEGYHYLDGSCDDRTEVRVKHEEGEEGEVLETAEARDKSRQPTYSSRRRDYDRSPSNTRRRDYDRSPSNTRRRDYDRSPSDSHRRDDRSHSDSRRRDHDRSLYDTGKRDHDRSPSDTRKRDHDRSPSDTRRRDQDHSPSDTHIRDYNRSPSNSRRRDHDHSPSDRRSSSKYYEDKNRSTSHSREPSVETISNSRHSSPDGSTDKSDEERERKHRKKKKKKGEHKSRHKHKHKHSRDKVRIKEEMSD